MYAFKIIYINVKQRKEIHSFVFFFSVFSKLSSSFFFEFFFFFCSFFYVCVAPFFLKKILEFEKKIREAARDCRFIINVIFYKSYCIRVFHVDNIEHYCIKILFLLQKSCFNNSFHFYVLCRLLVDVYHLFILFFSFICYSVVVLKN